MHPQHLIHPAPLFGAKLLDHFGFKEVDINSLSNYYDIALLKSGPCSTIPFMGVPLM